MQQSKTYNIIAHLSGWLIFFSLIVLFTTNSPGNTDAVSKLFSLPFFYFSSIYIFLFYINHFVLIPSFYLKKQYFIYSIIILLLFTIVSFTKPFDHLVNHNSQPSGPPPGPPIQKPDGNPHIPHIDLISIVLFIMSWALSTAICILRQWRITQQKAIKAEAERTNAELSFLKAQINPHFLFNTLNNLYTLAVTKNEKTADSIMKFSNILRYVTDEMIRDMVPLQSEIDCIQDYIDLQKLRFTEKTTIEFMVTGQLAGKNIAPLLLMTFVENVFKYGLSNHESSTITIEISTEEKSIHFLCRNRIFNTLHSSDRTGIGISNAKKRLEYLYPNRHLLNIINDKGIYTVELTLLI